MNNEIEFLNTLKEHLVEANTVINLTKDRNLKQRAKVKRNWIIKKIKALEDFLEQEYQTDIQNLQEDQTSIRFF